MTVAARNPWLGAGLVLLSAVCFSSTTASAVVSYEAGANVLAVITIRFVVGVVLLALLLRFTGVPLALPRRDRWVSLALGLFLGGQSFFLYSAFERIPIGLAMIIFYAYPLMVGVVESLIGNERMSRALWIALVVAFVGLGLVFNVSGDGLNTPGVVYAVLAGLGWGGLAIAGSRVIRGGDSRPVTLHMQASAAAVYVLLCLVSGDVELPRTGTGWAAYLVMPLFYTVAVTAFFAAVGIIGSVRASLIMNFEPVSTITLGFLILGQVLTGIQILGAALVVGALVALRWDGKRGAPET